MSAFGLAAAVFLLSVMLTRALRRYAISRGLLDVPNRRSSHTLPTPRGGGVAIVASFAAGVAALALSGTISRATAAALLAPGIFAAVVGFWDDHAPLKARWRLLAHFLAAAIALAAIGGMNAISVAGLFTLSGWPVQAFGVLMVVWLLNLYNFMDGIDGLAGVEAVTVCLGGAVLALVVGYPEGSFTCLLLAAASAGFLVWNFPPAKIFMGDAGSGFLGITFGVLIVDAARHSPELLWSWLVLLGAFIVDATVTLIRRLLRGEPVYQAHRSHAYQHAARALGAHVGVTLAFAAINLLWLLPIAFNVAKGWLPGEWGVAVAWAPLAALALLLKAGIPETLPR